jgi:hypothetical protein
MYFLGRGNCIDKLSLNFSGILIVTTCEIINDSLVEKELLSIKDFFFVSKL